MFLLSYVDVCIFGGAVTFCRHDAAVLLRKIFPYWRCKDIFKAECSGSGTSEGVPLWCLCSSMNWGGTHRVCRNLQSQMLWIFTVTVRVVSLWWWWLLRYVWFLFLKRAKLCLRGVISLNNDLACGPDHGGGNISVWWMTGAYRSATQLRPEAWVCMEGLRLWDLRW